eukprot:m.197690 g.197690  ORF g.197690 m.197690 type:complete len:311 (-) comp15477_c16_seq13:2185-3117(-)
MTWEQVVGDLDWDSAFASLQAWLAGPSLAPSWIPLSGPPCEEGGLCWDPSRVIFASAVFHMLQFVLVACFFSLFPSFWRLSHEDRVNWLSYVVSTTHSALASAGAVYSIFILGCYNGSFCTTRCHMGELSVAFSIGYFFYDYALMFIFHSVLYSHVYLVHHFLGAIMGSLTYAAPACQYISCLFLLSESSTPFVNMRWFLDKAGLRSHPLYFINGILMTLFFFLARLALTTYFIVDSLFINTDEYRALPKPWAVGLACCVVVLTTINTMWFLKMARGLYRALTKPKSHSSKENARDRPSSAPSTPKLKAH